MWALGSAGFCDRHFFHVSAGCRGALARVKKLFCKSKSSACLCLSLLYFSQVSHLQVEEFCDDSIVEV